MADIGDIHHMFYFVSQGKKSPFENIFKNIGPQITYVSIVINGGTTAIHPYRIINRFKKFFGTAGRIIQV
jgi:hypothetical protein